MVIYPIIILGSGPAGISIAVEALKKGYKKDEILILEKSHRILNTIHAKYPEEKLVFANYKGLIAECMGDLCIVDMTKDEFIGYMNDEMKKREISTHFNQLIKKITKLRTGQLKVETTHDVYIANTVFVAIGNASSPRKLDLKVDPKIEDFIHYDIQDLTTPHSENILVVGGGDSASEYAQILLERGYNVTLSYRGEDFSKMLKNNQEKLSELIKSKKIIFNQKSNIASLTMEEAVIQVEFAEEHYEKKNFNHIVLALGTVPPSKFLKSIGIEVCAENNEHFQEAQIPGIFLVGDLASGKRGGSIIKAFNSGVTALENACEFYLDCKN